MKGFRTANVDRDCCAVVLFRKERRTRAPSAWPVYQYWSSDRSNECLDDEVKNGVGKHVWLGEEHRGNTKASIKVC